MLSGEEILNLYSFSPNTDRLWVADFVLLFPPPSFVWLKPWSQWSFSLYHCYQTVLQPDTQTEVMALLFQVKNRPSLWIFVATKNYCRSWRKESFESAEEREWGLQSAMAGWLESPIIRMIWADTTSCAHLPNWLGVSFSMIEPASPAVWWGLFAGAPSPAPTLALWHPDQGSLVPDQLGAWSHLAGLIQPQGKEIVTD